MTLAFLFKNTTQFFHSNSDAMKKTPLIALLFLIFSCNASMRELDEKPQATVHEAKANVKDQLPASKTTDLYSSGKTKIIKTATYRFKVKDVKKSTESIEAAIEKYPAYISSSNLLLEDDVLENKITIRIQNEFFQNLMQDIDKEATFVNFRNVITNDVSKEFVDLESRLKTKREVEQRYMEILRKKAGTIEELLEAEKQIGALHEEIEATISRVNYLKDQVNYSTINLEFYHTIDTIVVAKEEVWTTKFLSALIIGWEGLVHIALGITYLWPLIVIAFTTLYLIRLKKKKQLTTK
jgi:hypothetical protein